MSSYSPEEAEAFNKDALLHRYQHKIDEIEVLIKKHWDGTINLNEFHKGVIDLVIEEEGENGVL